MTKQRNKIIGKLQSVAELLRSVSTITNNRAIKNHKRYKKFEISKTDTANYS